jgi:hypothetical protein
MRKTYSFALMLATMFAVMLSLMVSPIFGSTDFNDVDKQKICQTANATKVINIDSQNFIIFAVITPDNNQVNIGVSKLNTFIYQSHSSKTPTFEYNGTTDLGGQPNIGYYLLSCTLNDKINLYINKMPNDNVNRPNGIGLILRC